MYTPLVPVPEGAKKGWKFLINDQEIEVNSLDAFNPRVGHLRYGWNGRFDQPAFEQNPGRLVVYVCNHSVHGLLMGGAEEPRQLANGSMFTPAGGFDPAAEESRKASTAMPVPISSPLRPMRKRMPGLSRSKFGRFA